MVFYVFVTKMIKFLFMYLLFLWCTVDAADEWKQAPFIRNHPESITASKGVKIMLTCFVMGYPRPIVTWYKNGVPLKLRSGIFILRDDALVINKAQKSATYDDSGEYYCNATNIMGSERSKTATVKVKYLGGSFKLVPENATIPDLGKHIFRCIPPSGEPTPTVTWLKNNSPVVSNYNVKTKKSGKEYQLIISPASWNNRGIYSCVATNSEEQRISPVAVLKVRLSAPQIDIAKDVMMVYEGETVIINCQSLKFPQPTRLWSKVNGVLPSKTRLHETDIGILTISDVQLSDKGIYNCTAKNPVGANSDTVKLEVYKPMKFKVMPTGMTTGLGQTTTFNCIVQGGRDPALHWDVNGEVVMKQRTVNNMYVNTKNQLVFSKIEPTNEGTIKCVAEDIQQKKIISTGVKLEVLRTANIQLPEMTLTPASDAVTEGGSFSLTCKAIGSRTFTFSWILAGKNEVMHSGTAGIKIKTTSPESVLTLSSVILSDTAAYRCKVTSPSGATCSKFSYLYVNATDAGRPGQVPYVKVIELKSRSLKLTWGKAVAQTLSPISSYVITIRNVAAGTEKKSLVLGGDNTEKIISNLTPSSIYVMFVTARNKNGDGLRRGTGNVETLAENAVKDKLENIALALSLVAATYHNIEIRWNYLEPSRITSYALYTREEGSKEFKPSMLNSNTITSYKLTNLKPNTRYEIYLKAVNEQYFSPPSPSLIVKTARKIPPPIKVGMKKINDRNLQVHWSPPLNFDQIEDVMSFEVTCLYDGGRFPVMPVNKDATISMLSGLHEYESYHIYVQIKTKNGYGEKSKAFTVQLASMKVGEVYGVPLPEDSATTNAEEDGGFVKIIKETWFIVPVGVLLWLLLLAIVLLLCYRRCNQCKRCCAAKQKRSHIESSRGLIDGTRMDYPNTSLSRRINDTYDPARSGTGKKSISSCCKSQSSSIDEDFPNRAEIKPLMTYTRHESVEMKLKNSNGDLKETNIGVAMKNGYMVDTPLNNELDYRYQPDTRLYDSGDERPPPRYRDVTAPNSGSMPRREPRYQTDSVERRHAEIVRTAANKSFSDADLVNVMENNHQASWKRDKAKDSPRLTNKPPGENTLRRQAKTQFKPLPKLEVLNWSDGLPNPLKAPSTNGSQPSSPKMSSSASMFSENTDPRADSRMSHGDSSNSLNKYTYEKRRRRNSNASSMMSSELYQSEMDPSGYSDVVSDRKRRKEKAIPPPIDLDGLTSDILLQWAESVTNSSPSSSGSSSPDRLSGISSEGSIYTDEDFAQAVAAVVECGGFNMDYDYSLPGMPGAQPPLSASRNLKMNKIDQVLAQRSKMRNSPAASLQSRSRDPSVANSFVPQISMSGYLTGSQKGPQSTHSAPSGIPRATKYRNNPADNVHGRYGTGFQDVDSASTSSSSKPLTMSNLLQHDSSLERDKKVGSKPLTMSNLRQHETSLDRGRLRQQPSAPIGRVPMQHRTGYTGSRTNSNPALLPEAPLSVTSALERNESMHSNSKDSVNSSTKNDSEVENTVGTSERKPKNKKYFVHSENPHSSTSTVSTLRTSPDHGDQTDC